MPKIDFNKLKSLKKDNGDILACVVFKEHTLAYLFFLGRNFYLGILKGSGLRGGISFMNSPRMLLCEEKQHLREATQQDFDNFNVSSKGYISQPKKKSSL